MMVEVSYETFLISEEYVEQNLQFELCGFNIDETTENILLILKPSIKRIKSKMHKSEVYLKIWDTYKDRIIFENYITSPMLIGILET